MDRQSFIRRSIHFQLGTIGTEIGRAVSWRTNPSFGNPDECIARATSYINIILSSNETRPSTRRELARLKEVLNDWYYGDNFYQTRELDWDNYFLPFSIVANKLK